MGEAPWLPSTDALSRPDGASAQDVVTPTPAEAASVASTDVNAPDPPEVAVLAAAQGVRPIQSIDELASDIWPEDESMEEFLATLDVWRESR